MTAAETALLARLFDEARTFSYWREQPVERSEIEAAL